MVQQRPVRGGEQALSDAVLRGQQLLDAVEMLNSEDCALYVIP
jgi:hypothetical protein